MVSGEQCLSDGPCVISGLNITQMLLVLAVTLKAFCGGSLPGVVMGSPFQTFSIELLEWSHTFTGL